MEPSRSKFGLVLLVLAVLQDCLPAAECLWDQGNVHSLRFVFNITFNDPPWCVVDVIKDGTRILINNCSKEDVVIATQEKNNTNILEDIKHTLKDTWDKMRKRRLDTVSRTLQIGLECQSDASGSSSGPWEFRVDGRVERCLAFDSRSRKYKADNSRGEELKEKLENDEDIKEFLQKTSEGDCKTWLQLLVPGKKEGETAVAPAMAPATATPPAVSATPPAVSATPLAVSASPATTPAAALSQAVITVIVTVIILVILILIISVCVCYKKRRCCWEAPESVVQFNLCPFRPAAFPSPPAAPLLTAGAATAQ